MQLPLSMNDPAGVCVATAPGMPIPAGTWRGAPFTKIVRCAWMWYTSCSLVLQAIPSTACPVAIAAVPASGAPAGTGTPSAPFAPGAGAGRREPRVLSAASLTDDPPEDPAEDPEVAASVPPTAAAMTATATPPVASQRR